MNKKRIAFMDRLNIIWTIAVKDILDSLRNRLALSLVIGLGFLLLMPKMLGLLIQSPYIDVSLYDPGKSILMTRLVESERFNAIRSSSTESLKASISSMGMGLGAKLGLEIPEDFDQRFNAGEQISLKGYIAWANRTSARQIKAEFEEELAALLGVHGSLLIDINIIYPEVGNNLLMSITTLSVLVVILMMGLNLIPHLLFEEKQTKTMDALLVSPASHGEVVAGKALAGIFYIVVAGVVVFVINWNGVVHWLLAVLFITACGVFCVAVGLILGTFFSRQQEVTGLTMVFLLVLIGAVFVLLLDLNVPDIISVVLPWVPSVALMELIQFVFVGKFDWAQVYINLLRVAIVSAPLFALVVWKIRRSDR